MVGQLRSEIRQSGHHQDDVDGANQNYLMVTGTLDQTNMNDQVILECYMRTYIVTGTLGAALDSTYSPSDPAGPTTAEGEISRKASWGRAIRYRLIPGTSIPSPTGPLQLYTLVQDVWVDQPQNGYDVGDGDIQASEVISGLQVCDGVREMTVNLTGASAEVVMTLAKTNPDWSTLVNGAPEPLGVVVRERVQMQNAANGEWDTAEVTATAPSWP